MRRRYSEDADTLRFLFLIAREADRSGLSPKGLVMLVYLAQQLDGEAPFAQVRDGCGFSPSQTTRISDNLIEDGLLVKSVSAQDRRTTVLKLTAKGRNVIERILQAAHPD